MEPLPILHPQNVIKPTSTHVQSTEPFYNFHVTYCSSSGTKIDIQALKAQGRPRNTVFMLIVDVRNAEIICLCLPTFSIVFCQFILRILGNTEKSTSNRLTTSPEPKQMFSLISRLIRRCFTCNEYNISSQRTPNP